MAVHLIFCRIIAEVVRPLPPSVRRHPPRHRSLATPVILLFVLLPRCPAPVAVGRVDERGRALCLTFCKNCPPPAAPYTSAATTAITSASSSSSLATSSSSISSSCSVYSLLPSLLRLHFLTLRCPVSPMVFCCTRSDVRRVDISCYRGEEFPI